MTMTENSRATLGGNSPPEQTDWAAEESARLAIDYKHVESDLAKLLDDARALPREVTTDAEVDAISDFAVRLRDLKVRLDGYHDLEKQPHLRRGQAVDNFFFSRIGKLMKRNKGDPNGTLEILTIRVNAYQNEKAEKERRARLEKEAEERRVAEAARLEREEAERKAREAEEAAARARNVDRKKQLQEEAEKHKTDAKVAQVSEDAARTNLSEATVAAQAKPADLVRQRSDGGSLSTMRQVPYVEIVNAELLDLTILRPFIKEEHLLMALKAWGKVTSHKKPMPGAIVEMRNDTVLGR